MHNQKTNDTDEFITQVPVKELEKASGWLPAQRHDKLIIESTVIVSDLTSSGGRTSAKTLLLYRSEDCLLLPTP